MNLYYITNNRLPTKKAHGLQIASMCNAFGSINKLDVELIIPFRNTPIKESIFDYYGVDENFEVNRIQTLLPTYYGFLNKLVFWLRRFIFIGRLLFMKFPENSIIYTRQPEIAFALSTFKNVTEVYEDHGWPNSKLGIYKFLTSRIDNIVAITEGIKKRYEENDIDTKVLVAHDGVDLEKFKLNLSKQEAREQTGLPESKKILMYVGSFLRYEWKGVDLILEVSERFSDDYLFVLIGGKEEEIKTIKNKYDTSNMVLFKHQEHEKIPKFLKSADALVLPNKREDRENNKPTSPLKLFEYMASKRPIIASKTSSILEILDTNNSFLLEPEDLDDLQNSIKKVFESMKVTEKKVSKAKKDVEKYSWKNRARRIINFIKEDK